MKFLYEYDQIFAYTIKNCNIMYVKKVHYTNTMIHIANVGVALPLAYIGCCGSNLIFSTIIDYFPDYIKHEAERVLKQYDGNAIVICSASMNCDILEIHMLHTDSEHIAVPVLPARFEVLTLP